MTEPEPITVLLVDDHLSFLEGLTLVFERDPRVRVSGTASTAADAVELVKGSRPDVVLLDYDLNDQPAERTIRQILRVHPNTCIVMLTMHDYIPLLESTIDAGARTCLNKRSSGSELIPAILAVQAAPRREQAHMASDRQFGRLTSRELQVLLLVSHARSNRQISEELSITEGTVKRHLHDLSTKLNAVSRMDAVRKARTLGYLD